MRGLGGDVIRADVMTDQGGRSRGCGIVEFANPEQAAQAIEQLNNSELKGRMIFVREVGTWVVVVCVLCDVRIKPLFAQSMPKDLLVGKTALQSCREFLIFLAWYGRSAHHQQLTKKHHQHTTSK